MKKFFKIFFISIGVLLLLLIVLPFFFVGTIENKIKTEINNQLNAKVGWDKISLSLIRDFPNVSVGLEKLFVVGVNQFENDTLAAMDNFSVSINLKSVFSDNIQVNSIIVERPLVNAIVAADSTVNWDIMKPSTETEEPEDTTASSSFMANLQQLKITDGRVYYTDHTSQLVTGLEGLMVDMSGDLSASTTDLSIQTSIQNVFLTMEKTQYLNKLYVGASMKLASNLDSMTFRFVDGNIDLNKLSLGIDGSFAMLQEGYDMDLKLFARQTDFKTLLGLVPADMLKDFEAIKTSGKIALEATAKGTYVDEEHLPAFNLLLSVQDASFQYPDLPESIQNIQIVTKVNNPGGSADNTVVDVEKFHFEMAGNPFDASLNLKTPISNATFVGQANGTINLTSLKNAIPLDSMTISGIVKANIQLGGDMKLIESENYEEIKADGSVVLSQFVYTASELPLPVYIDDATMNFSPRYLELANFTSRLGETDFTLNGRLENYLAYALKDGTLKGVLAHSSKNINVDQLMSLAGEDTTVAVADTAAMEVVAVPKNIDFVLNSRIGKLNYDKLIINNTAGKIIVRDGRILLEGLNMNLLGGSMLLNGQYNTQDEKKPFVDFLIDAKQIDINLAANSFSVIDSLFPMAKLAKGNVSTKFTYNSLLGNDMMPVLSSVNGLGMLKSGGVEVSGSKVQSGLVSMLKDEKYNTLSLSNLLVNFKLENGNLFVQPFTTNIWGKNTSIEGRQGLDKTMEYKMTMPFSRQEVSKYAGMAGLSLSNSGADVPVTIAIKGTVTKPVLSLNANEAKEEIKEEIKQEVKKEVEKAVDKLKDDPAVKKTVDDAKNKLKNLFK
ncbi:MAG: AsmA family protein [Marinilabiliaceae bacterium]|nr:AsmA family protein [Marinilabiliaceae bacterium]